MTDKSRNRLGQVAFESFVRHMSGASGLRTADSWAERGERNKEQWRCIAEDIYKAVMDQQESDGIAAAMAINESQET